MDPADVARRMADAVPHRGPTVRTVVLGRSALACRGGDGGDAVIGIVDGLAIALVGSLDNSAELAQALGCKAPVALNDAAMLSLLAAGYRAFGLDLPARMRGVFAGAISSGDRLYCFRDHIGYRPLFYRTDRRGFYAATEAKQIVAGAGIPKEPDMDVVAQIFFRTLDDDSPAALKGVNRLPKSSGIETGDHGYRLRRYWHPETLLEAHPIPPEELKPRFDRLMDQAVARCLTGRDAIALSGGVDSPAVAAYAAPRHLALGGLPLQAISVVYPKYPTVDESRYVVMLADRFGIPLHTYEQTASPVADLARWVSLTDTPFVGAALAQYEEDYRRIHALGCRMVLTGEHAEFVFAMQWNTLDHFLTHGRLRPAWREMADRRARGRSWLSVARFAARSIASDRLLAARAAIGRRPAAGIPEWVDRRRVGAGAMRPARDRWRLSQLRGFIGPGVSLEAEEVCQAVTGVTSRKPWTDVDLWEFFLGLPAEQKFPDLRPKGLVRDLLRGRVPDMILDREDKTVFDEAALAEIDYAALTRVIDPSKQRVEGVDYAALGSLLTARKLGTQDYRWARSLATVHAFLAQWA